MVIVLLNLVHTSNPHLCYVPSFKALSLFAKMCQNIFDSTHHAPHAMFKKYPKVHNQGIYIGFIKRSEYQMGGEQISLLQLFCLHWGQPLHVLLSCDYMISRRRLQSWWTMIFGSIFSHCVMLCMLHCVIFAQQIRRLLQWTNCTILYVRPMSCFQSIWPKQRRSVSPFVW